jgi:maltose 6'-phosphate phosphatase
MKLLTLNLHCFAESNIAHNQDLIVDYVFQNDVDVIFLEEVAQYINSPLLNGNIKVGNYGQVLSDKLNQLGKPYYYYFDVSNQAFGNLDEGLAILSKYPLSHKESFYVSRETLYDRWQTRKIVKASIKYHNKRFDLYTVHLGWSDGFELFEDQVDALLDHVDFSNNVILAGDFNVSETSKEYEYIVSKGLHDLYGDESHFHDVTHLDYIDVKSEASRIDYIFSNKMYNVLSREIVFKEERVSDHYGVMVEIEVEE